ncbi:MAG: TrkH family potassium uptake protein [Spirochaetaceae bacterium]|jgi:trk system potassium uptake protein TrkH|nr:TrkH family potassium uptake protein [Spirochaetaceae bacterium]
MKAFLRKIKPLVFLLDIAAGFMIIPLGFAALLGDAVMVRAFALPLGGELLAALPVHLAVRNRKAAFAQADGFFLVFAAWLLCALLGAFPYWLSGSGLSFTDSVFESACGFATTGATTVADVEALPRPLLLWRSMSHWLGGLGIVVLTIALFPLLGMGGFQLAKAEAPGAERQNPRLSSSAKFLWLAYSILTALLFLLYRLGGMSGFDALCHALPVMASGGVSTRNAGMAFFDSPFIDGVSVVFMLLAGLNFNLYLKIGGGKFREALSNTEARAYLLIFALAALILGCSLVPVYGSLGQALRYGSYQAASVLSTTGSVIADYGLWPPLAQAVILALMFIGGCSGSTAGGIKVIRHVLLWKQAGNEIRRSLFPRGVFALRLNGKPARRDLVHGAAGFVCLYALTVIAAALVSAAAGLDMLSAGSIALAMTGNTGMGFGAAGPGQNFGAFPDFLKWFYSFVMIAGRLELWTALVMLSPAYWRR